MSGRSYKNLIKSGFYFNKKVFKYRETDLTEIKNEIRGVGFRSFYFFTRKVEFQKKQLTSKFSVNKPNELALINSDLLKNVPVNADVINLHRYNILRKYLIRSFKGRCHIKGKPVNGQRTWSNAQNPKNVNTFLRKYVSKGKVVRLDSWS